MANKITTKIYHLWTTGEKNKRQVLDLINNDMEGVFIGHVDREQKGRVYDITFRKNGNNNNYEYLLWLEPDTEPVYGWGETFNHAYKNLLNKIRIYEKSF